MKSSPLVNIILSFATIGLSLPAHADEVVTNETVQTATITGSNNSVTQSSSSIVSNSSHNSRGNRATVLRTRQVADVQGDNNTVNQSNETNVENNHRYRYRRYH
jgi:hypothetical protein